MQKIFADVAAGVTKEVYLASEVDAFLAGINEADEIWHETTRKQMEAQAALIAEMEKILRLCFFNIYPSGTTFEDAYAQALKAANELMVSERT